MSALNFIKALAPELSETPGIDNLIVIAESQTGAFDNSVQIGSLGTKKDHAIALRTLHMIAKSIARQESSQGGFITSESEGELSRGYEVNDRDKKQFPDLITTTWGIELIAMIRSTFFSPMNRMM